jgi:hypothetical protein
MKPATKFLLQLETAVCFAPAAVLLLLGVIMLPSQIYFLIVNPEDDAIGALLLFALTIGGIAGLVALANLLWWIMNPSSSLFGRWWTLAGAAAGCAALLPYTIGPVDSHWWRLVGLMPLGCTAHLIYLGRDFLFPDRT